MIIPKSFYFIRHGQTRYNRQGLCAGSLIDAPLDKTGKQQAQALKAKVQALPVNKVVCSPLKRAIQTANLARCTPHLIEHNLQECNLGDFEGTPVADFIIHCDTTPPCVPFANGESRTELASRVLVGLNSALHAYGENVLFVSHGMVYWAMLSLLNLSFHPIDNAALVHVQPKGQQWGITIL